MPSHLSHYTQEQGFPIDKKKKKMYVGYKKNTHCINNEFVEKGVLFNFKGKNNMG